jgi:hypothetical protein
MLKLYCPIHGLRTGEEIRAACVCVVAQMASPFMYSDDQGEVTCPICALTNGKADVLICDLCLSNILERIERFEKEKETQGVH